MTFLVLVSSYQKYHHSAETKILVIGFLSFYYNKTIETQTSVEGKKNKVYKLEFRSIHYSM